MGRGREKKGEEEVSGSISNSATSPKWDCFSFGITSNPSRRGIRNPFSPPSREEEEREMQIRKFIPFIQSLGRVLWINKRGENFFFDFLEFIFLLLFAVGRFKRKFWKLRNLQLCKLIKEKLLVIWYIVCLYLRMRNMNKFKYEIIVSIIQCACFDRERWIDFWQWCSRRNEEKF